MLRIFFAAVLLLGADGALFQASDVDKASSWDSFMEAAYQQQMATTTPSKSAKKQHINGAGVLYSAAGAREFVQREVLPTVKYLQRVVKVGDRAARLVGCGFAIFFEAALLSSLSVEERNALGVFFDKILVYEDHVSKSDAKALEKKPLKIRAKLVKVTAMLNSPFEVTIFLDFDARPCSSAFASELSRLVGSSDIALTNKFDGQERLSSHMKLEHNSACVVLNSASPRTELLMGIYLDTFKALQKMEDYSMSRDQPALMVALRVATGKHGLVHHDISADLFCRSKISKTVSCDAGCLIVHKPQKHDLSLKTFIIGGVGTQATSVAMMLDALGMEPKCPIGTREKAAEAVSRGEPVWDMVSPNRVFWDAPWSVGELYVALAQRYPRAKFVLTVRDTDAWWSEVESVIRCSPKDRVKVAEQILGGPFFEEEMSKDRFVRAYERRNEAVQDYFASIGETDRLLVLTDLATETNPKSIWSQTCNFLESWSSCPLTRPIPGIPKRQPDCPPAPPPPPKKQPVLTRPPTTRPPTTSDHPRLRAYKDRVAKHLNTSKEASMKPPKPPSARPPRSSSVDFKSAAAAGNVPRWHPECAERRPRGILYNRIPKSGSASVMSWMAGQLNATAKHRFGTLTDVTWWTPHIAKHRYLDGPHQREYLDSLSEYGRRGRFVTQRHVYYTDGVKNAHPDGVELVNLARDPIDRCISRYNYEAFYKKRVDPVEMNDCLEGACAFEKWSLSEERHFYQDFPLPTSHATLAEWRVFRELSANESMALLRDECHDYMTRWFCGHGPECRDPQRPELALSIAKHNVEHSYAHVGVLEDLPNTVQLFRVLLPTFFQGDPDHTPDEGDFPELHSAEKPKEAHALDLMRKKQGGATKSGPLSPRNLELLYRINKRDIELYHFILALHRKRIKLCLKTNGDLTPPPTPSLD